MNQNHPQIVITGSGLTTPLGLGRKETWRAVLEGRCGMGPLTALEQPLPAGRDGGQCPELPAGFSPGLPREVRYLRHTIAAALIDAHVSEGLPYPSERCGILLGTTLHGMRAAGVFLRSGKYEALADFLAGSTLRNSIGENQFRGLSATTCSACSSSLGSIALGASLLQSGKLDLVVAGGYDTICEYVYGGFNSLRLVAGGPLRPFSRGREGMKLAEGYGIVVLERAKDACGRGQPVLATILGWGESADAHHLTQPHPGGEGAARAMTAALASAGIMPDAIGLIAAHSTGTPDNDAAEYAALARTFGGDLARVPVVAFKSHLGHTLGAAGAVELILSALCLRDQMVPGCPNVRPEDIEFPGLQVATGPARGARIRATLNTSLGFGGANACVILGLPHGSNRAACGEPAQATGATGSLPASVIPSRPNWQASCQWHPIPDSVSMAGASDDSDESALARTKPVETFSTAAKSKQPGDVFITGIGVVLPGAIGNDAFVRLLDSSDRRRVTADTGGIPESDYIHLLNARRVRRMSDYVKLTLAATMLACRDAGIVDLPAFAEDCAVILGSAHGSTIFCEQYYSQIVQEGMAGANPTLFAEGVPNAAAAHLSLMLSLKGPCQTVIGSRTAGLDAIHFAANRIAFGEWERAIVGAAEEYSTVINNAYACWGLYGGQDAGQPFARGTGFATGCGAVTFILESADSLSRRQGVARGRLAGSTGPVPISFNSAGSFGSIQRTLEGARHVISSANGTWLDRLEHAALRSRTADGKRTVTSMAGHLPECFSVTPMAAIAAGLLTGRMPKLLGEAPAGMIGAGRAEAADMFGVLASDYTRVLSCVKIERA